MKEFKKYIIGFIIGLLSVGTFTYAADTGSIGALFSSTSGSWKLLGSNIEANTITAEQLDSNSVGNSELIDDPTFTTIKLGNNWTITTDGNGINFTNSSTSKTIKFGTGGSISSTEYNYN